MKLKTLLRQNKLWKKKEVEKLFFLARIKAGEKELEEMSKDVSSIISYIEKLKLVDADGVAPFFHFLEVKNAVREDKCSDVPEKKKEKLLPVNKKNKNFLRVESIL